jgi:hypothetical protein
MAAMAAMAAMTGTKNERRRRLPAEEFSSNDLDGHGVMGLWRVK